MPGARDKQPPAGAGPLPPRPGLPPARAGLAATGTGLAIRRDRARHLPGPGLPPPVHLRQAPAPASPPPGAGHAQLETLLRSIDRPGDFCAHGRLLAPMPRLEAEGADMVSFPAPEARARALIEAADTYPHPKCRQTHTEIGGSTVSEL